MFNLPFFSQEEPKNKLGIDVGSTAVKIMEPEEVSYSSAYLDKYSVFDTDSYTEDLVKRGVNKALNRIELNQEFDKVLLSLPPAVFKAQTVSLTLDREKEGKISKREKVKLTKKAKNKVKDDISSERGILKKDFYFKNWELIKIKIDGYNVSKLEGYEGEWIKLKFLVTYLLNDFMNLKDMIGEDLEAEVELVHSAQGMLNNEVPDGIYLDVGGEITHLFIVKGQELKFVGEAKVGGRTFSQVLAEEFGLSELRSKVLKERYSEEELSQELNQGIKGILKEGRQEWMGKVKKVLEEQETKSLPSKFFLLGGGSKLKDVQQILKKEQWDNFAFLDSPEVKFFTPKKLGFDFLDVQFTPLTLIIK